MEMKEKERETHKRQYFDSQMTHQLKSRETSNATDINVVREIIKWPKSSFK